MRDPDLAIALRYDPDGDDAPRVVAKGRGAIAAQIVALAREHRVAIRRDRDLAALLGALKIDCPIPVAAFTAVAEILAHLYRANRQLQGGRG
ncbi:MAG TPA: EscU/YscU/HrcU family type III secretion system export apparatus switch protein [Geminicoccaceae bacterium]|jgi:flagellar biosynthesis protein|nr:EscU/YscU/HrcU family type III secretion system export apparatus switch protein [Geminicoccaceae bacterium]